MKRYDLAGSVEQFGAKQFWVCHLNDSYDMWVSYNTVVAVVDHVSREIFEGYAFRGYSRTTSKQTLQASFEFARGYEHHAYKSDKYNEFMGIYPKLTKEFGFVDWDTPNKASFATHCFNDLLK